MDSVDKRLLFELADNGRIPVKTVAAAAGVSREVADYRIKRLEKRGVIRGYKASLQSAGYFMLIQSKDHVLNRLRNKKYPHWIGRASGSYGALLSFSSDPKTVIADVCDIIDVKRHQVLTVVEEYIDSYASLFGEIKKKSNLSSAKLDSMDEKILEILRKDARTTNAEIAKSVGLTAEAVRYRIQRLEITYKTVLDIGKLGFKEYFVLFGFGSIGKELEESIKHFFSNNKNILYAARTLGSHSVVAKICSEDDSGFDVVLSEIKDEFELDSVEVIPLLEFETI